jgi:hypothetical protein
LKPGGTTFTSGMDQLLKQAPLITSGLYKDVADAASLLSAFSLSNKFGAGENVQQFTRATVGGIGKMRGVKLEGDSEKVGEYLRGLGATTQMDPIEIGKRISADLAREEAEAKARGEDANLYNYLMYHGYGAQEERMALLGFHGLQKTGQFQNIFEPLAKTPPPIDRAQLQIQQFQAADPLALAQKRDVASDLASVSKGVGAPEYYQNLKVLAYERLRARNEVYGKAGQAGLEEWENGWFGWIDGSRQMIVDEARKVLEEQGKSVGVTLPRIVTKFSEGAETVETPLDYSAFTSEESRAKAFYEFAGRIGAAGGKPNADLSELVALTKKQIEIAERSEKLMREGLKVPVGPLTPARPGPGWVR